MSIQHSITPKSAHVEVRSSHDVHQQAELLDTWNQEYCQMSGGKFDGSVTSIHAHGIRLFVERMNQTVLQKGHVGNRKLAFGIPLCLDGQSVLCGEKSYPDSLHVFSGQSGFEYLSQENLFFIGLEISLPTVSSSSDEKRLAAKLKNQLKHGSRIIPVLKAQAQCFRSVMQIMFNELKYNPSTLNDPKSLAAFKRCSMGAVLEMISHREEKLQSSTTSLTNHWRLISQIRTLVEKTPDSPMSVAELALLHGVSRRTIQYACHDAVGTNPKSYVRALRLSGARREMRNANSVTEAATRWGFWHFSNFARDYHSMFGELPSQTHKQMNNT
jgi:AraC family ethanolamine operon transcriptional activator